jgi:intracellular septation protein
MVLSDALPLNEEGWMILTRRMMWLFVGMAAANEAVWRFLSTDAWVNFKTFGLPIIMFAFLFSQFGLIKKYSTETDADPS